MKNKWTSVCLLASVINHENRFIHLLEMLKSMKDQINQIDIFCVSIHILPELNISDNQIKELFFENTGIRKIKIIIQKNPKTQFEQIKELCEMFTTKWFSNINTKDVWVIFTDDDDIWNQYRTSLYLNALKKIYENENVERTKITGVQVSEETNHIDPTCCSITNFIDVDDAIECGCVNISSKTNTYVEYHRWMVPLSGLLAFLKDFPFFVHHNRYTDVMFSMYNRIIESNDKGHIQISLDKPYWSYFYRNGSMEYPCVSKSILDSNTLDGFKQYIDISLEQLEIPKLGGYALINLKKSLLSAINAGNDIKMMGKILLEKRVNRMKKAQEYDETLISVLEINNINKLLNTEDNVILDNWNEKMDVFLEKRLNSFSTELSFSKQI